MEAFSFKKSVTRTRLAMLGAAAISGVAVLLLVNSGSAAAPSALTSLTGTVMSIQINATTTINALTFQDTNPSEVVAANGLKIRIPATVNAIWDANDTTAAISGSAATSTGATPTVAFSADLKVMTITALDRFTPSSSITISGLNIIGVNYETAGVALDYATDGTNYGAADATTAVTVTPATLVGTNVEPVLTSGVSSTSTVSFTMTTSTPPNGKISVTFPTGFDVSGVATLDGTCPTMDGNFAATVSTRTVTITRSGGTREPAGPQTCYIGRTINPGPGTAGTYTIETQASAGAAQTIETDTSVTADTFTAGALTLTNVEPSSLIRGFTSTATVSFTTATSTPITGKIIVNFPGGYDVSHASSGTCSTMDGTFTTTVSGQNVIITRAAGTLQAAAAESCTIANIINPISSGPGGVYAISTTNSSSVVINQDLNVASDSFTAPGVTPPGGGSTSDTTAPGAVTGVSITLGSDALSAVMSWTNPTDSDLAGVRVFRSTASGSAGTQLTETLAGSFTNTGLTAGTTYYYSFRTVDTTGNEYANGVEYALTATPGAPPATPSTPPSSPSAPGSVTFPAGVAAYDLVRGSTTAVYYVSSDGKRHAFPNLTVYLSWYPDFSAVKNVSSVALAAIPLGKNVTMRSGTYLVKIISDPKVYAIEPGGILRWVPSEATARTLYGTAWAARVRDIDATLFADYTVGGDVLVSAPPAGMVASDGAGAYVWIVRDASGVAMSRRASAAALALQRFPSSFAVAQITSLPVAGTDITGFEAGLAQPYL